jgi:hypothetical protein
MVILTARGRTVLNEAIKTANAMATEILPEDQLRLNPSLSDILKLLGANIS